MIEETMRKIGISDFLKKPQEYERLALDYLEFLDSSLQSAKFSNTTLYRGK